jgi:hypothetical protein
MNGAQSCPCCSSPMESETCVSSPVHRMRRDGSPDSSMTTTWPTSGACVCNYVAKRQRPTSLPLESCNGPSISNPSSISGRSRRSIRPISSPGASSNASPSHLISITNRIVGPSTWCSLFQRTWAIRSVAGSTGASTSRPPVSPPSKRLLRLPVVEDGLVHLLAFQSPKTLFRTSVKKA